jgi:hypothetical protein
MALMKGMQGEGVLPQENTFQAIVIPKQTLTKPYLRLIFLKVRNNGVFRIKKMFEEGLLYDGGAFGRTSLESRRNYPSSISYNVVTNILQKNWVSMALFFTDALNMKR